MRKSARMKTHAILYPHSAFISDAKPQTWCIRMVAAPTNQRPVCPFAPL